MARLTAELVKKMVAFVRLYIPIYKASYPDHPGLARSAHKCAHYLLHELKIESNRNPLDEQRIHDLFYNLNLEVGKYIADVQKEDRQSLITLRKLSSKTETFKSFLQRTAIHLKDVEGQYGLNSPEYKECWLQNEAELASRPLEERIKMKGMFSWMYGTLSK